MWAKGMVIGKFYPPHAGHRYLIDTAQEQVAQLTILVCRKAGEKPDAVLRAEWLRELHPRAIVRVIEDIGEDDNSELWASYTTSFLGYAPDVVFSSEDYGAPYARFMGCAHVLEDKERQRVPCAGRVIRADPFAHWRCLPPPARAFYALRIALIGAESTGTTTLARDLASAYQTSWVPEYGRAYSEGKMSGQEAEIWRTEEFVHIARMQNAAEDALACAANKVLFCDTTALATAVWHERYMGFWSEEVEQIAAERSYGLTIITDDSIPFVQDGLRDGEHIRHWMHERFLSEMASRKMPYVVVTGNRQARLQQSKDAVALAGGLF